MFQNCPLKIAHSCCFRWGGKLDFLDFLQKIFYNIHHRKHYCKTSWVIILKSSSLINTLPQCLKFQLIVDLQENHCLFKRLGIVCFLNGPSLASFCSFSSFQTNNTTFTTNQFKKCPSSMQCWDSNARLQAMCILP